MTRKKLNLEPPASTPTAKGKNFVSGIAHLGDLPAVKQYLQRIGAEPSSMRRAIVEDATSSSYKRAVATIELRKDGEIEVRPRAGEDDAPLQPTEPERAAIRIAAAAARWPESFLLGKNNALPDELKGVSRAMIFELRTSDGKLIMIQRRVEDAKSGRKRYEPWSYWDDGKWRRQEPDGKLPLYGLETIGDMSAVFLHEGAKAARATHRLVNPTTKKEKEILAAHPWGRELSSAAHIGWIGGAPNASRTDWSALATQGVKRVYIVADNDKEGVTAVKDISWELRGWNISVMAMFFDSRWPAGFDLADEFPEALFTNEGAERRYIGPAWKEVVRPATWATRRHPAPPLAGRGRPKADTFSLRSEFAEQWHIVNDGIKPLIINRSDPTWRYLPEAFAKAVKPFCHQGARPDELLANDLSAHADGLTYDPGKPHNLIAVEGRRLINRYRPAHIVPIKGDPSPWLDYLCHLFPDEPDRRAVMRWCATLIARPGVRMGYGVLLVSNAQGVGKSTLLEILRKLVGAENSSSPTAQQVVDSSFNDWIANKRLVGVNEIYHGQSWTAYQRLKSYVTEPTVNVNEKHLPTYTVPNWAHFLLCSNLQSALRMENSDRRFLVPKVTEARRASAEWDLFHGWLAGDGHGIIAHWAEEFVQQEGAVRPGEHAPMTSRKQQFIEDSRSEAERRVRDLAEAVLERAEQEAQAALAIEQHGEREAAQTRTRHTVKPVVLVVAEIAAWVAKETEAIVQPMRVREWLGEVAGLHVSDRMKVRGNRSGHLVSTKPLRGRTWKEISSFVETPEDYAAL